MQPIGRKTLVVPNTSDPSLLETWPLVSPGEWSKWHAMIPIPMYIPYALAFERYTCMLMHMRIPYTITLHRHRITTHHLTCMINHRCRRRIPLASFRKLWQDCERPYHSRPENKHGQGLWVRGIRGSGRCRLGLGTAGPSPWKSEPSSLPM